MKGYDTADYAATRLNETIIRLGDEPVMVLACHQSGKNIMVTYSHIMEDMPPSEAPLEAFNLDPVPLGYVNFGGRAVYMTRMPMRKDWRQGMRMSNIVDHSGSAHNRLGFKVLGQTIMGKYPTFERVIEGLNRKSKPPEGIAFCRDFSIKQGGLLEYKGFFNVGLVNLQDASTTIDPKYEWVREAFNESVEIAA